MKINKEDQEKRYKAHLVAMNKVARDHPKEYQKYFDDVYGGLSE